MRIDHCAIHLRHSSIEDLVTVHGSVMAYNKALLNVGASDQHDTNFVSSYAIDVILCTNCLDKVQCSVGLSQS